MQFIIHPEIFERFPGMHIAVVVAQGIDNQVTRPQVEERWREIWAEAAQASVCRFL
jgi:DNA/RNA-binding domain of Phe-tRNA-synthetase-like protein